MSCTCGLCYFKTQHLVRQFFKRNAPQIEIRSGAKRFSPFWKAQLFLDRWKAWLDVIPRVVLSLAIVFLLSVEEKLFWSNRKSQRITKYIFVCLIVWLERVMVSCIELKRKEYSLSNYSSDKKVFRRSSLEL